MLIIKTNKELKQPVHQGSALAPYILIHCLGYLPLLYHRLLFIKYPDQYLH
jgi:hypothetical protein